MAQTIHAYDARGNPPKGTTGATLYSIRLIDKDCEYFVFNVFSRSMVSAHEFACEVLTAEIDHEFDTLMALPWSGTQQITRIGRNMP